MTSLMEAIKSLKPSAEFSFINEDYSTVKWDILEGTAPTQSQLDAEISRMATAEIQEAHADATSKAALLKRLGITADEAALLLG